MTWCGVVMSVWCGDVSGVVTSVWCGDVSVV